MQLQIDKVGYKSKTVPYIICTCAFPYIYSGKWISELFRPEFFSHSHKRNDREISKASSVEQSCIKDDGFQSFGRTVVGNKWRLEPRHGIGLFRSNPH